MTVSSKAAQAPAQSTLSAVVVRETKSSDQLPLFAHVEWQHRFPWLLQGTTGRGKPGDEFDLSFFGQTPAGRLQDRWRAVLRDTRFSAIMHARQVHHAHILVHGEPQSGIVIRPDADGHVTNQAGLLLAVSVADCVPVFLIVDRSRSVALLHAGWRGAAAQILHRVIAQLLKLAGGALDGIHCHLGPAICGNCYEVGPEVHEALGQPRPGSNTPIDLRRLLREQAVELGLPLAQVSQSQLCTRCDNSLFFSHRAGDRGRQMGLLGIRAP